MNRPSVNVEYPASYNIARFTVYHTVAVSDSNFRNEHKDWLFHCTSFWLLRCTSTADDSVSADTTTAANEDSHWISATRQKVSVSRSLTAGFVASGAFVVLVAIGALFYSRRRYVSCPSACGRTTEGDNAIIVSPHLENISFENQLYGELQHPSAT